MPSQFITPPDHLPTKHNILILNALETELSTLVLWLKTVPEEYNIHLFHNEMPETDWAVQVAKQAQYIVSSSIEEPAVNHELKQVLQDRADCVARFGANTEYTDLIQFFLTNKQSMV